MQRNEETFSYLKLSLDSLSVMSITHNASKQDALISAGCTRVNQHPHIDKRVRHFHLFAPIFCLSFASSAPENSSTFLPFLKNWKVGMHEIEHSSAVSAFSSTSTCVCACVLMKVTSVNSVANASNFGPIILHGPHHVAVKSTATSLSPALV